MVYITGRVGLVCLLITATPIAAVQENIQANSVNCTTNSFSIPSWFIENFRSESGKASFCVSNRASESTYGLECKSSSATDLTWACATAGSTTSDPSLQVSIKVKPSSAVVQVKQSWACGDRNLAKPLQFTASGNTTIPLTCSNSACQSSNQIDLVKGTLHVPISGITPAYAQGPDGHANPGCVAASKNPQWTLGTVIYLNETGEDQLAVQSQSIQFHVINQATGYMAGCLTYFSAGPGEDPGILINCGVGPGTRDRYTVTTQAVFYPRSWQFTINQTWFCDDIDAARPITITATGTASIPLTCTKDSPTTTACQTDSAFLPGTLISQTPLPPYSISDPLPAPDGCTISSIISPSWLLSNFAVEKNVTSPSDEPSRAQPGSISFNIKLNTKNKNLFDYPVFVGRYDVNLMAPETWYPCSFGPGELPLAPKSCSFRYESEESRLAIRAEWVCVDVDEEHPVLFSGVATTTVPDLECGIGGTGLSLCGTIQGYSWVAEVDDVTWRTLDALPALI